MGRTPNYIAPAASGRTGKAQLSVSFSAVECAELEALRQAHGFRSWAEVIRAGIAALKAAGAVSMNGSKSA